MELCRAFKFGTSTLFYVVFFLRSVMYVNGLEQYPTDHDKVIPDRRAKPDDYLFFYQGVEGTPGVDFPVYSHIPRTTFNCKGLESGYYADIDTDCQVFHICEDERKISFLCPNGTIFQQSDLICEWWFKVNCSHSPYLYEESAENLRENTAKRKASRKVYLNSQELKDKNVPVIKENSFADSKAANKYNSQYVPNNNNNNNNKNKNNNSNNNGRLVQNIYLLKPQQSNIKNHNLDKSRNPEVNSQSEKIKDNNHRSHKNSNPVPKSKSNHRNQISNAEYQKNQSNVHQKTRRFNDNELGNYENSEYDRTNIPTSLVQSTTEKYTEHPFKGYYVQFAPSTTGTDKSSNNIDQGPEYNIDSRIKNNPQFAFQSHVKNNVAKSTTELYDNLPNRKTESNKKPVNTNSEEAQITQESASFLKNSYNSIQPETSSYNPFPNHRTTYSDLKTIPHISTKVYSTISSVTPQYITTQPINNGKPFLGSRVGINIKTTKDPLFVNPEAVKNNTKIKTQVVADDVFKVHVISNAKNVTNSSLVTPKVLQKILFAKIKPIDESTTTAITQDIFESDRTTKEFSTLEDFSSTTEIISTINTVNLGQKVTPKVQKNLRTAITSKPFLIQYDDTPETTLVTKKSKTPDYAIIYGSYSTTPIPSNAVQVKFDKTVNKIGIQLGKSFGSSTSKSTARNKAVNQNKPQKIQQPSTKPRTGSYDKSKEEILVRHSSKSIPESLRETKITGTKNQENAKGFYVTRFQEQFLSTTANPTETTLNERHIYNITIRSTTQQPRPFQRYLYESSTMFPADEDSSSHSPILDYKLSTASPFTFSSTVEPTLPTPFRTSTPSIYENIDNMIDVLTEITKEQGDKGNIQPRPGLVVPPSVGPQTLHTLAVYFANALDEVISKKVKNGKYSEKFMEENKDKLTTLLTQMTVHGYNQLFDKNQYNNTYDVISNNTGTNQTIKEDLKLESPQIRQLARNFTLALSAYLNDPEMFRKDLENFRPTEPPFDSLDLELETTTEFNGVDEELLNYSDADAKTSFPPFFSTSYPPSPTWGFIIAAKSPNKLDVENSVLSSDLNTADTQSFLPGFNDINSNGGRSKAPEKDLPQDHWTTSTTATNLWQSTFSIDPALLNGEFGEFDSSSPLLYEAETSTESSETEFTTPETLPIIGQTREVNYELHSLPKFSVNSSEVSGILIDFMNNSTDDPNDRLHRILRKLNTTEDEFVSKMKEIESNPITRRLILLLISECGKNATQDIKQQNEEGLESLELSESNPLAPSQPQAQVSSSSPSESNPFQIYVDPNLKEEDQDTRALQLLNTLYNIASKLGK